MSTGNECSFIEIKPGEWWYLLEDYHAPKNSWDWREYSTAYGPFTTEEIAFKHLCDNHANPGGYSTQAYHEGYQPDKIMIEKMTEARARATSSDRWRRPLLW